MFPHCKVLLKLGPKATENVVFRVADIVIVLVKYFFIHLDHILVLFQTCLNFLLPTLLAV